jgi:multidrug transporter EmrE-like cation transporter
VNPYLLLVPVFLLCVAGSGLSYTDGLRRSPWYTWWMILLGGACAGMFAWAAKMLDSGPGVYRYSLFYDAVVMSCYYLLPLLAFGTRVSPGVLLGAAVVVAGLVIVKVYG